MKYEDIFSPETLSKLNKQSAENLKAMLGDKTLMQTMISSDKLLGEIMEIEAPYKEQLEQLAIQIVEDTYPIINDDSINIDAKIVSVSDVNQSLNESTPESKRRVINGITQGAALNGTFSFYMFKEYLDVIDDTLVEKYNQLMKEVFGVYDDDNAIAMFLNAIAQGQKTGGGSSKVIINEIKVNKPVDKDKEFEKIYKELEQLYPNQHPEFLFRQAWKKVDEKYKLNEQSAPTIQARAICFPMLVHEIIKGLYELVSLQGFSGTKDQNQTVVDKVDKLENEPYDLKYGKYIYDALNNIYVESGYNDSRIREFFFAEVYQLGDQEFIDFIENALNNELTPSQQSWIKQTLKEIQIDLRDDDFDATGLDESKSPCWDGYKKQGTKQKNGKRVNNCVPIKENEERIECSKCEWSWDLADGGDDPYTCHKCGNINTPKEYTIDDEEVEEFLNELKKCTSDLKESILEESEYQGRKVTLNKPMQGDSKKFKVYVKNEKGNIVKVNFGAKGMNIKKNNPVRRKAFRARHNCENPGPKWKARYWSCKKW